MRLGILSDIHAGLGENDHALRRMQTKAVANAAAFLADERLDMLVLAGDTTDHLKNALSAGTNADIAREVLAPLATMIRDQREDMKAVVLSGNTDWVLAEPDKRNREIFFETTGLPEELVHIPKGGLLLEKLSRPGETGLWITHGHAMKPAAWGHEGPMDRRAYLALAEQLRLPDARFLADISAVDGAHRKDYLLACAVGYGVRPMPSFLRHWVQDKATRKMTADYEPHLARVIDAAVLRTHHRCAGVMGHTHVEGIRRYGGVTIVNTGTAGAKPNPLQRYSDPRGHAAVIDTSQQLIRLVRTFNAARPDSAPEELEGACMFT